MNQATPRLELAERARRRADAITAGVPYAIGEHSVAALQRDAALLRELADALDPDRALEAAP